MWILLDSQSTVDLITNPKILVYIRMVRDKDVIRVHYNSGSKVVNQVGKLPVYVTVWYEPTGIANTLSISRVTRKYQGVFDSKGGNFFRMALPYWEVQL